ncbi:MAG: DUF6036 family nucleotidyltransferase [Candidatus Hermodarchaeota archaeon]
MVELQDILSRLEKVFSAVKIRYVIVGGIAVIHYGHVRTTQDIDILIEDDPSKFSQFLDLLRTNEFDVMDNQFHLGYQEKTNISIFNKRGYIRLDLKVADKKKEKEVLDNAVLEKILDYRLYIAPLEYVLLGKIIFLGRIDDLPDSELFEYQDIIDFLTLYHANKEKINLEFLKKKTKEINLDSTLDKLLSLKLL